MKVKISNLFTIFLFLLLKYLLTRTVKINPGTTEANIEDIRYHNLFPYFAALVIITKLCHVLIKAIKCFCGCSLGSWLQCSSQKMW